MKRAFISLFLFIALASVAVGQNANDWFITVWDMWKYTDRKNSPSTTIAFPGIGSNYRIDWENVNDTTKKGTVTGVSSSVGTPYYLNVPSRGTYRLKVYKDVGTFTGFKHSGNVNNFDFNRLIAVEQWGTTVWTELSGAFLLCKNMDVTATDKPDLSSVTSLNGMFHRCENLVNSNGSMKNWATGNITKMNGMFQDALKFNQPIGNWNTSSVVDMQYVFSGASSFNQSLNWNTANVTDMAYMFQNATAFNKPFGSKWTTANVLYMRGMFQGATSFNQNISNWNTGKVTIMEYMFRNATSFNKNINNWNTLMVTDMAGMFQRATSFNQPLNNWKTEKVTNMMMMFQDAIKFNQPLNNWKTEKVTNMWAMFKGATAFNQPLNSWNTTKVFDMAEMFKGATAFNQPLNGFEINDITIMSDMIKGCSMSCENLSNTLESWATQATTLGKNNINLGDNFYYT